MSDPREKSQFIRMFKDDWQDFKDGKVFGFKDVFHWVFVVLTMCYTKEWIDVTDYDLLWDTWMNFGKTPLDPKTKYQLIKVVNDIVRKIEDETQHPEHRR